MKQKKIALFSLVGLSIFALILMGGCDLNKKTMAPSEEENSVNDISLPKGFGEENLGGMYVIESEAPDGFIPIPQTEEERQFFGDGIASDSLEKLAQHWRSQNKTSGQLAKSFSSCWYVSVPFYSQVDGFWAGDKLGWSSLTIRQAGCHVACVAMLYAKWGYYNMNPREVNNYAKSHNGFNGADLIPGNAITYPGLCRNVRWLNFNGVLTELSRGHPVICHCSMYGGHFVVIFGWDGYRFWFKDSMRDWRYQDQPLSGYSIYSYRSYGY